MSCKFIIIAWLRLKMEILVYGFMGTSVYISISSPIQKTVENIRSLSEHKVLRLSCLTTEEERRGFPRGCSRNFYAKRDGQGLTYYSPQIYMISIPGPDFLSTTLSVFHMQFLCYINKLQIPGLISLMYRLGDDHNIGLLIVSASLNKMKILNLFEFQFSTNLHLCHAWPGSAFKNS